MSCASSAEWLEPWRALSREDQAAMERELRQEVLPDHPLFEVKVRAVARGAGDDVLFKLENRPYQYAVVHLVWQGPQQPPLPATAFYSSFAEWLETCMKTDYAEFSDH